MKDHARLRGGRLPIISPTDPNIDWESSSVDMVDYFKNPFENFVCLKPLEGKSLTVFYVRFPLQKQYQFASAFAGIKHKKVVDPNTGEEKDTTIVLNPVNPADEQASMDWASQVMYEVLFRLCTKAIDGPLFDPQENVTFRNPQNLHELKPEVIERIESYDEAAVIFIGMQLFMEMQLSGKSVRESVLSRIGNSPSDSEKVTDSQPVQPVSENPNPSKNPESVAASILDGFELGSEIVKL